LLHTRLPYQKLQAGNLVEGEERASRGGPTRLRHETRVQDGRYNNDKQEKFNKGITGEVKF
jgi:hypothetical protein